MSIDAIGIFVYVVVLRYISVFDLSIKFSAITIGVMPLILKAAYGYVTSGTYNLPLYRFIVPTDIVIALAQLITTFIVLYIMQQKEDDTSSWFMIAVIGAGINYTLIPFVIPMFVSY